MSIEAQDLMRTFERLPESARVAVADFARRLLDEGAGDDPATSAADRWLATARGAATVAVDTDELMALSRGEP